MIAKRLVLEGLVLGAALCAAACVGAGGDTDTSQHALTSCTTGKDCPVLEGCGSDHFCHADGECQNTWQQGVLVGNCPGGQLCASPGESLDGFCTDDRGGPDPYCRSDGQGSCRALCVSDDDCGTGNHCDAAGFCHRADECATSTDCSPNHFCGLPDGWEDDGYLLCLEDPNPTCVDDGQGACRLPCASDADCFDGGGCASDGLCHASNECATEADCPTGQLCYASTEFGGLCGPGR